MKKPKTYYIAPGAACSPQDIRDLEAHIGSALPGEYAAYLLEHNGAQPVIQGHENDGCIIIVTCIATQKRAGVLFNNFIRLKEINSEIPTILDTFNVFKVALPENMLPIARDPGNSLFLLVLKGQQAGSIMYWGSLPGATGLPEKGRPLCPCCADIYRFY